MRSGNKSILNARTIVISLGFVVCIIISFIFFSNRVAAENSREVNVYYTSYEIQPGDTLWTIADQFMTAETSDKAEFISSIKKLNHISSDNITAGNYLVIEYVACEEL